MASDWQVRVKKEQLERAAQLGKQLFFIGYHGGGRAEAFMYMDPENITLLWLMAHNVNHGKMPPAEAFAAAQERIAESERERAEKLAATPATESA